jgi:hypothetical protein
LGWGYPYYYGAGYYNPYYYDPYYYGAPAYPAYAPAVTYAAPAVTYGAPAVTYAAPAAPATTYYRAADFYLIAFNDHSIRAAQSFQVRGDQLEWTPKEGGAALTAPLASVDKRFSEQINRDRRVRFVLP